MFTLIKDRVASKWELENCYTLSEALKLYALMQMDKDVERCMANELKRERGG